MWGGCSCLTCLYIAQNVRVRLCARNVAPGRKAAEAGRQASAAAVAAAVAAAAAATAAAVLY